VSRPAKDRRLHRIAVEGYSQTDRRRIFKMLVRDDQEALSEEDMINIIHDGNLFDHQMLKVLAVLLHCSGYIIKDVSSPKQLLKGGYICFFVCISVFYINLSIYLFCFIRPAPDWLQRCGQGIGLCR
jgi:uncharacterized protein YybS (DUF2232 family)